MSRTTLLLLIVLGVIAIAVCTFIFTLIFSYMYFDEKRKRARTDTAKEILDKLSGDIPYEKEQYIKALYGLDELQQQTE